MATAEKKIPWYKKEIDITPVKTVDIVTMTKNLSIMLTAGLTVPESLEVLVEASSGKLKKVLSKVNNDVQSGNALGEAMEKSPKVFSPIFVSSVKIGESSGTLAENLSHLSEQMSRDLQVRRNIQGAMFYPAIVISAAVVVGFAIATFVLPQMAGIFDSLDTQLPWTTRLLMWIARLFDEHGLIVTPTFFGGFFILVSILRLKVMRPIVHKVILRIPAIGPFIHDINRARFCRGIGTLLESGVPIQEGLKIGSYSLPNYVYRTSVKNMHNRIGSGENFSEIVENYPKLYPKMVQRMISVGERSGGMGESLLYLATFYEEKVEIQAKNFSTIIEPILLMLIGLVVGFVAVSIFTPIYSVTDALSL
ncbi:type II secretion system F family protein [Candidatus Uhrbacteria bacterium]|jgi:type II secretory pathway component PulF|nr:type II secretion system F family protein [Candidatus Uhrbacteria bacterium]